MAEVAATSIGIAGVVGVLHSLLQCYKDFLTARDFGDDYAILQLRAALLENSTTSWAIAVGLIDESGIQCNKFLVARPTENNVKLVEQILSLIRTQLNKANEELAMYTMDEPTSHEVSNADSTSKIITAGPASPALPAGVIDPEDKRSLVKRVGNKVQRMVHRKHDEQYPGTLKRTVWALVDKDRVENVLNNATTLVDRLNTDFAPVNQKQQLDKYCQDINDLHLSEDELQEIGKIAGDKLAKRVLKMLGDERQTGNRFIGMKVTKDGTVNIGDHYDKDWKYDGERNELDHHDVYESLCVTDTAFVNVGNSYGGKSPVQIRLEQMQATRQVKSGNSSA